MALVFSRQPNGVHSCRIGPLQVSINRTDLEILVFESQTFVPCESGNCPEGLNEKHCPRIDNCPYEVQEESEAANLWEGGRDTVADVEMRVRELLREGSDGVGHRVRWPQPAATRFAASPWIIEG